jgi:enamine deaminase RidA (YjgF/YER057c/UK114 family)
MRKQVVQTDKVPPARVPLSQAIKVGEWLFVSGQLGSIRGRKAASGGISA